MKITNLMLVALAASMTFVACSKDDGAPAGQGTPKSVTIKLANVVTPSRSAGGEQIVAGKAVTLTKYQVFFSDGTNLYPAKEIDNQTAARQYFDNTTGAVPTEGNFHFLPAAVNEVIVIGNHGEIQATTKAQLDLELSIADEQDANNLTLYASSTLTLVNKTEDDNQNHPKDNLLYEANLSLAPTIARLYVKGFTYKEDRTGNRKYSELKLEKLALNNYYTTNTLVSKTTSGLTNEPLNNSTVWDWFAGLATGFHNDALTKYTLTPTAPFATSDLYYHIFAGKEPQLALRLTGDGTPLYLATSSFKTKDEDGGAPAPVEWKAGTVYEIEFNFSDTDFDQPDKCIDITVTPVNWVVVAVTPEF